MTLYTQNPVVVSIPAYYGYLSQNAPLPVGLDAQLDRTTRLLQSLGRRGEAMQLEDAVMDGWRDMLLTGQAMDFMQACVLLDAYDNELPLVS